MLMITRKPGETVWIGTTSVTINESRDGKVKLAIDAPPDVPVVRDELLAEGQQPGEWRKGGFK